MGTVVKFKVSRELNDYEYMDENLFKDRINYFVNKKLLFNPLFVSYSGKYHNGKQYFEYLLDFIMYNKENSLLLLERLIDETGTNKWFLLKKYIEEIRSLEHKYNTDFYDIIQLNALKIEGFDEACDILLRFTKDFEFPLEIDLTNEKIMTLILDKIKFISLNRDLKDNQKLWVDFNTIRVLISLYDFVLCKVMQHKIMESGLDFLEYSIESYINMLCDELYAFLNDMLKSLNTVHGSNMSYDFLDFLNEYVRFLLRDCSLVKLDKKKKKKLFKFYYLLMFYGNYVGNEIEYTNTHLGMGNYAVYNIFSGFKSNVNIIKKNIISDLNHYSNIIEYGNYFNNDNDIISLLDNTIFKNSLLESAYYQKALLDYSPIFKEMEYTPILVNLFKTVEEISCDLFEYLKFDKILINRNEYIRCCYFEDKPVSFDDKNWKDKIMLGGIEKLIYNINTKNYPMYLNGKDVSNYNKAYDDNNYYKNDEMYKFLSLETPIEEINNKYSKEFGCELISQNGKIKNSDVLRTNFKLWIDKCRNGTLHKHNVFDNKRADFCFDFTLYMINMLLEWAYILKKSVK